VRRRSFFESESKANPFVIQLDILEKPTGHLQTAVFIKDEAYPAPRENTANLTFKFRRNNAHFIVEFRQASAVSALRCSRPPWIKARAIRCSGKCVRVAVGTSINAALVRKLLRLARFVGKARRQGFTPVINRE
jgi:hypothetical protein